VITLLGVLIGIRNQYYNFGSFIARKVQYALVLLHIFKQIIVLLQ